MTRETVDRICAGLPGAHWADHNDGGLDAWKVGEKMFACIGMANDGVSVKTRDVDTAQMLIEAGEAMRAKYFHKSWVRVPFPAEPDVLQHRIVTSYDLVRGSLTRKVQASLPQREV